MKCEFLFPVTLGLALGCSVIWSADDREEDKKAEDKPLTVTIRSLEYDPQKLEIHVGDSVVWKNEARTKRTATSTDEGRTFDTQEIEPGQSSNPVKFEKAGEFRYDGKVHGEVMRGTVVVKAAASK
jgi:plastocyanin